MYDEQPEEIEIEAIGIEVSTQPIELYKVFKIANLVDGGGEAKHIITEGYVAVNGELETRKRRKLYDGDLIEFNQEFYLIICNNDEDFTTSDNDSFDLADAPQTPEPPVQSQPKSPVQAQQKKSTPKEEKAKSGRKSIDFL